MPTTNSGDGAQVTECSLTELISQATRGSLQRACSLVSTLTADELDWRHGDDRGTYLHAVVGQAPRVYQRYGHLSPLVCLVYRLAMGGARVNGQDAHGNTPLHLACIRPHAQPLCAHLIRVGIDPCITNKHGCRVIHTYRRHQCQLVKGQTAARSGLWHAVENEDATTVHKLMKSWCRVNVTRNKSLTHLADETANQTISKLLTTFRLTNELVCAAMACDAAMVKGIMQQGQVDLSQHDEAELIPKPLLVALQELGSMAKDVIKILKHAGASGVEEYNVQTNIVVSAFEESAFYQKITDGSHKSLLDAVDMISHEVNVDLVSQREETKLWTYLHLVVDKYITLIEVDAQRAAILIRAVYRLALAGIDVNARDAKGETALAKGAVNLDQDLMAHLIRIGIDPSITDASGCAANEEVYEDKGKLVFDKKYRVADLPGLWVAVETNDVRKARRWLRSWARVAVYKGDRSLLEIARALSREKIVALLESYHHINEFVMATFASDLKTMMDKLSLGNGAKKVNTMDDFCFVGLSPDCHAEFMSRPIIVTAVEICTPQVVDFLLRFGADLSVQYEEKDPCGPIAFWAFRDHVHHENTRVVATHADVCLRNELGMTLLHCAVQKSCLDGKAQLVQVLLERGVDIAARDWQGCTARDYLLTQEIADASLLRQLIDNHVVELVNNDQHYRIESLIVDGYDHLLDIRDTKKNKNAREIALLREFKEMLQLLDDLDSYQQSIELLHRSAKTGDLNTVSKLSGERRCAFGRDRAGRSLLHNAVLYEHADVARFLVEQFPNLVNTTDSFKRTPLHICACLKNKQKIWSILLDGEAEQILKDVNNMSVHDYVREMEDPTATKYLSRGRRIRQYRPHDVIEQERTHDYYVKVSTYTIRPLLTASIQANAPLDDIRALTDHCPIDLSIDGLDEPILRICNKLRREDIAQFLTSNCRARSDLTFEEEEPSSGVVGAVELRDLSENVGLHGLTSRASVTPTGEAAAA